MKHSITKKISLCLFASTALLISCSPNTGDPAKVTMQAQTSQTYVAVSQLIADYGFLADQRDTSSVSALFTQDGRLIVPSVKAEVQGRGKIAGLYGQAWKPVAASGQQRRHIITGLKITEETANSAHFRAIMNVAGKPKDGSPQIYMTGYYTGEAVKSEDGWRFKSLTINVD